MALLVASAPMAHAAQKARYKATIPPDCASHCRALLAASVTEDNDPCAGFRTGKTSKTCAWALREGTKDACAQLCEGADRRELRVSTGAKACHMTRQAMPKPAVHKSCIKGYQSAFDLLHAAPDTQVRTLLGQDAKKEAKAKQAAVDTKEGFVPEPLPAAAIPQVVAEPIPAEKELPSTTFFAQMEHLIHDMIDGHSGDEAKKAVPPAGPAAGPAAAKEEKAEKQEQEQEQSEPPAPYLRKVDPLPKDKVVAPLVIPAKPHVLPPVGSESKKEMVGGKDADMAGQAKDEALLFVSPHALPKTKNEEETKKQSSAVVIPAAST